MKRFVLLAAVIILTTNLIAQNDISLLYADNFKLQDKVTYLPPKELLDREFDDNDKPWAMIEVVADGFDGKMLKNMKIYSESFDIYFGLIKYMDKEECLKIYLSSGVEDGSLIFKYENAKVNYSLPKLRGRTVYQLTLSMRSANLTIVATPAESKIFIDGNEVGNDGYASVDLKMGRHTYSVECDGYMGEMNKSIMLSKNETIHVALQPLFGYVTITSRPSGADVIINGERAGVTPYLNKKINRGVNNIEVQLNGYYEYAEFVEINNGELKNLDVQLVAYDHINRGGGNGILAALTLRLSEDTLRFDAMQSRDSVFISTNNVEWNFQDAPRWISLYKRNNILYVTCNENLVHKSREADIVVFTGDIQKTLHVYQDVGKTVLKSGGNKVIFNADRDSTTRHIETNVVDWTIKTSAPWIKAYEKGDTLVMLCEENTMPVSRQCSVEVQAFDQEIRFDIAQKSRVTQIDVPADDIVVDYAGGITRVPTGLDKVEWMCYTTDKWMTVTCSGSDVLLDCQANDSAKRHGSFVIATDSKKYKIDVVQNGPTEIANKVVINSKPSWSRIFVDGKKIGRTPLQVDVDDSLHTVRLGREKRLYMFNDQLGTIAFNTGLRYIQATTNVETVGLRSGFIGNKHWGGYNHFQISIQNWDFDPDSDKQPVYIVSFGPSYELFPWMSLYAGLGAVMTNDTIGMHSHTDTHVSLEIEAGLMFYYRKIFASCGIQTSPMRREHKDVDFSAGIGLYFNKFYDPKHGYCATRSRQWWSVNYMFNTVRHGHGIMFSDIGKHSVRAYIKAMVELPDTNETDAGLSAGIVFNAIPGYIDLLAGAGYQMSVIKEASNAKGLEAELGFVLNVWRIPLTVMMRYCELEKDSRGMTIDFGVGFNFGSYNTKTR